MVAFSARCEVNNPAMEFILNFLETSADERPPVRETIGEGLVEVCRRQAMEGNTHAFR
jgi:hypothetical protein